MSDASPSRVLFCAFAEVPGTSSTGTRTAQWLSVFGNKEMDALSLKGTSAAQAAHIQRLGGARMMRVPNTAGKPLLDKLSTYRRALQRQLAGEPYDLVWCADLFSAAIAAPLVKGTAPLIVEVAFVPSQSRALTGDDAELKKSWRDGERAAIRAAARVLVPSRHSAKLIAERIDPRVLQVVQRAVDRTVYSPPSVEIAIDDERLVLVFGGREGGARTRSAVAIAQALAITLPGSVRIGLLGMPGADPEVRAALGKLGLGERVELIDADSNLAVSAALSLAHVVVVPSSAEEDAEPFALPHRALEAMACGRAVVVTGPEAAFKDTATPGEHLAVVPARDPRAVADAVEALLEDSLTRASLGRAAARHVERTCDLMTRSQEVHALISEATKATLKFHAPRGDDPDTSSRSMPAPPPPSPARDTAVAAPPAHPSTRPSASGSGPVFASSGARTGDRASDRAGDRAGERAADRVGARAARDADASAGDDLAPRSIADLPGVLSVTQPMPTVRMEVPHLGSSAPSVPETGGMWDGDTFLDGNLEGAPLALQTSPDAARVRAAMLVSSDAQSKAESSAPSGLSASGPARLSGPPSQPSSPAIPTSLLLQADLDSKGPDPWSSDTIADGTPVDTGRDPLREHSSGPSSGSTRAPPKKGSFLVDASTKAPTGRPPPAANAPVTAPHAVVAELDAAFDRAKETTRVAVISDDDEDRSDMTMEDQPLTSSEASDSDES